MKPARRELLLRFHEGLLYMRNPKYQKPRSGLTKPFLWLILAAGLAYLLLWELELPMSV